MFAQRGRNFAIGRDEKSGEVVSLKRQLFDAASTKKDTQSVQELRVSAYESLKFSHFLETDRNDDDNQALWCFFLKVSYRLVFVARKKDVFSSGNGS